MHNVTYTVIHTQSDLMSAYVVSSVILKFLALSLQHVSLTFSGEI